MEAPAAVSVLQTQSAPALVLPLRGERQAGSLTSPSSFTYTFLATAALQESGEADLCLEIIIASRVTEFLNRLQEMNERIKEFCYSLLDAATFGKGINRTINGVDIKMPTRYYKYYESDYEKESFAFIKEKVKPGFTVLDIGGHIGLYATAFGKLVGPSGKVYSFEPTPVTNKLLQKTVTINDLKEIVSVQKEAISKEEGETFFYVSDDLADNSNSLVNYAKAKSVKGVRVPLVSIDVFRKRIAHKIDFIKIDVEGAELDAVKGASETLLNDKPTCILALHPHQIRSKGDSLEEIWDVVTGYNYTVSFQGKKIDKNFFCIQKDLFDVWLLPL